MPSHRLLRADVHAVPPPFRSFAVRSDERALAWDARAPHGRVHLLRTPFLDRADLARLAARAAACVPEASFSDVQYARTGLQELAADTGAVDLARGLAQALCQTGVLGEAAEPYRASLETRIDFLGCRGAGFHNDVGRHWSRCLFWILALELADVEFVLPHASVRAGLAPGDLLVFDPALAHGLCRPGDHGLACEESFEDGPAARQFFLTGELALSAAQWQALGCPWRPIEWHDERAALDLMVAEFDERSGAIKRLSALRAGMKRSTCHVDEASP